MTKPLLNVFDEAGYGVLSCDCEKGTWVVIYKRGELTHLRLFCTVCNSYSFKLVPETEEEKKQLQAAADEAESLKDIDWGTEIEAFGKKPDGLN